MARRRRRTSTPAAASASATLLLLALLGSSGCDSIIPAVRVSAYITSGLPGKKHRAWLKRMTTDIVASAPGDLSPEMISAAPELMAVWASNPYAPGAAGGTTVKAKAKAKAKAQAKGSAEAASMSKDDRNGALSAASLHWGRPGAGQLTADGHGLECALAVEGLLKRLVDEREAGNADASVTTEEYNAVLHGWANSGRGGAAAQRAEQILIQMQDQYLAGDLSVRPDLDSFKHVLTAWSLASRPGPGCEDSAPDRAQAVLDWMLELGAMDSDDEEVSSAVDYDGDEMVRPASAAIVPDAECFDLVLRSWAGSSRPDAPYRAEAFLIRMDRLYLTGNEAAKLHTQSFNEVLTAWGKCGDRAASDRAEVLLRHMEKLSDTGELEASPNLASYTTVASSCARVGGAYGAGKAEKVLRALEKRYNAGDVTLRPDTILYNICLDAWVKAQTKDSHQRARGILNRQIAMYNKGLKKCRPDVYSYTLVLNSCASMPGTMKERSGVFDIAWKTYQQLLKWNTAVPNHVTYGTVLKACCRLLPRNSNKREQCAREVFNTARREGRVGKMVLGWLRDAVRPHVYEELMWEAKGGVLPDSWTRNVYGEDDGRRQQRRRREV